MGGLGQRVTSFRDARGLVGRGRRRVSFHGSMRDVRCGVGQSPDPGWGLLPGVSRRGWRSGRRDLYCGCDRGLRLSALAGGVDSAAAAAVGEVPGDERSPSPASPAGL